MNKIEFLANIDKYKGEDHSTFLQHYGILGQKWGQRRWQNADGTTKKNAEEKNRKTISERKFGDLVSKKSNNISIEEQPKDGESIEEYQAKMKKLNNLAEKFDLPTGNFESNNGVGVIKRSDMDIYDNPIYIKGKEKQPLDIIDDHSKDINKMIKALDKNDWDEYQKIRNNNFKTDEEKDLCERFVNDVRSLKEIQEIKNEISNEVKDMQKPIKKDFDHPLYYNNEVHVKDMRNRDTLLSDNNKVKERMKDFVDNYDDYIDKIANKVADYWTEMGDGKIRIWSDDKEYSRNDFIKRFKNHYKENLINSGNIDSDGTIYLDFNDDGMFGYHGICAIIEPDGSLHNNTGSLEG